MKLNLEKGTLSICDKEMTLSQYRWGPRLRITWRDEGKTRTQGDFVSQKEVDDFIYEMELDIKRDKIRVTEYHKSPPQYWNSGQPRWGSGRSRG